MRDELLPVDELVDDVPLEPASKKAQFGCSLLR